MWDLLLKGVWEIKQLLGIKCKVYAHNRCSKISIDDYNSIKAMYFCQSLASEIVLPSKCETDVSLSNTRIVMMMHVVILQLLLTVIKEV